MRSCPDIDIDPKHPGKITLWSLFIIWYFILSFDNLRSIFSSSLSLNSKLKYGKLAAAVRVPQNTQNSVISRCCFAQDNVQRFTTHVHSHCSAHSERFFFWWLSRCRCRRGLLRRPEGYGITYNYIYNSRRC